MYGFYLQILDIITITLVISVLIANQKLFIWNLLLITIPMELAAVAAYVIMFLEHVKIWYYHLDVVVTDFFLIITSISCYANIARHLEEILFKNIIIKLIFPCIFAATGHVFCQIYLFSKFRTSDKTDKCLIRLVYYPSIVEVSLILIEYSCRTFDGGTYVTVHGRAHYIFFYSNFPWSAWKILDHYLWQPKKRYSNFFFSIFERRFCPSFKLIAVLHYT